MDNRYKLIKHISILLIIVIIASGIGAYLIRSCYRNGISENVYTYDKPLEVSSDSVVSLDIDIDESLISGVLLSFDFSDTSIKEGEVILSLFDVDNNLIGANKQNTGTFVIGQKVKFKFPQAVQAGGPLRMDIGFGEVDFDGGLSLVSADLIIIQNDTYLKLLIAAIVLFVIMIIAIYYMAFIRERSAALEYIYLVAAIYMGLLFMVFIPVMEAPDEPAHAYTAYEMSNSWMGIGNSGDTGVDMRADDEEFAFKIYNVDREYIDYVYDGFFDGVRDDRIVDSDEHGGGDLKHVYILPAIGITIGKLLGASTILMYMIGRLLNVAFFIGVTFCSIKLMPFAKPLVAVWALLPVTLQQASSMSRDCPIFALCTLITALTLNLYYSKDRTDHYRAKLVILLVAVAMLLPCKSFAYFPVCALPLILITPHIRNLFNKLSANKDKRAVIAICIFGLIAALGIITKIGLIGIGILVPGMPLSEVARILINTLRVQGDNYLFTLLGSHLGWLDVELPRYFVVPFLVLLILSALRVQEEPAVLGGIAKLYMAAIFIAVCFIAIIGMLSQWTPEGYYYIEGVQGRHFLPALVMMMLVFNGRGICIKSGMERVILFSTIAWEIMVITGIVLAQV